METIESGSCKKKTLHHIDQTVIGKMKIGKFCVSLQKKTK